jgi:hypothetical protein
MLAYIHARLSPPVTDNYIGGTGKGYLSTGLKTN